MDGWERGWRRDGADADPHGCEAVVHYDGRVTDADFADPPPRGPDWDDAGCDIPPETGPDGRPLYAGRPGRDPYRRGGGHRQTSPERWAAIRDAYLAGESGSSVAARFGMARSTFFAHARDAGWLRQDQPEAAPLAPGWADDPVDLEAETAAGLPDYGVMAAHALVRMQRAILNGRAMEAGRWLRLHARLTALAKEAAAGSAPDAGTTPSPAPSSSAPRAEKTPDPQAVVMARMRAVQTLAQAAAGLNPRDPVGRTLLNKSLAILDALDPSPGPAPISDCSDCSDAVFQSDPPPRS